MRDPISELYPWESVIFSATRTRLANQGVDWAIEEVNTLRDGPDSLPEDVYSNLYKLFRTVIDPISIVLGQPLFVSSSYRSLNLDRAVAPDHYSDKDPTYRGIHTFGKACDIALYTEYALGDFGRLIRFPGASSLNLPLWYAIIEYRKKGYLKNLTSYALGRRYQKSIISTQKGIEEFYDYDHLHLAIDEKRNSPFTGPEDGSVIPDLSTDGIALIRSVDFKAPNSMAWFYRRVSHISLTELGAHVVDNLGQPLTSSLDEGNEADDFFQNEEWRRNHWDASSDGLESSLAMGNDGGGSLYPGIDVSEAINSVDLAYPEEKPLVSDLPKIKVSDSLEATKGEMVNNLSNVNLNWHNLYP